MDLASTLMGLGLLLVFVAPVGFIVYNQTNKEKKRAKKLAFLAGKHGYLLDEVEHFDGLSLAVDKVAGKLLLLRRGEEAQLQVIDIKKISEIALNKVDEDDKLSTSLDETREISLMITSEDLSFYKLVFYAEEDDPVTQKADRLHRAQKWQKKLQSFQFN